MFPAIAPQMRRRKVRLGAGSAPRLALANDRLLGSSKAHHEWVDRALLAVFRRSGDEIDSWLPNGDLRPRLCEKSGVMSPVGKKLTKPPLFEAQSHSSSRFTAKSKGKLKSFPTVSL